MPNIAFSFIDLISILLTSSLLLLVGVSTAAPLRTGPHLGVEGGEGGGSALAGGVPHLSRLSHLSHLSDRGVEGGVVQDRDGRDGGIGGAGGGHVVQRDAGQRRRTG